MQKRLRDSLLFLGLCLIITLTATATEKIEEKKEIPVGVILDLNSALGTMINNSIEMGLNDFYSQNPDYTTRLRLHITDSQQDPFTAASAARDLINNNKVHAILGPQDSEQASYVVELGDQAQVPVMWFSTSGPSLLPPRSRYFIRAIQSRCFQFKAIAAIAEAFNWQSVVPIYEDPEFGNDLIPCLTYALKEMDRRVQNVSAIDPRSKDEEITKELIKLKDMQTNVFLVHMTLDLGSKLMKLAQQAGMMSEGYAWILTQGLSSLTDPSVLNITLQGALGVRPRAPRRSNVTEDIEDRFKGNYSSTLTLYGWWAYDTITALAMAVENASEANSTFFRTNSNNQSRVDHAGIGMYDTVPTLLKAIEAIKFEGQTGFFSLSEGQVESRQFEVYNVKEHGESIIGYWCPVCGLVQTNSTGVELTGQYKLKIGVPKTHFTEFVDVNVTGQNISTNGFAIKVFEQVLRVLPSNLSCKFVPLTNKSEELTPWSYDELICSQIEEKKLDAIIGDITIVANRTRCVDFTFPYLDSSVSMVQMVRPDSGNKLILLKPFDPLLWSILGGIFVSATITVIILEGNKNGSKPKKTNENGSKPKEMFINPFLVYKSDIKGLESRTSRWMVILISFVLIIVVQVYTANLTSILTERTTAKPSSLKDIQEIKRKNRLVGYQRDSWVRGFLIEQIGFNHTQLMPFETPDQYYKALSDGTDDDEKGVAAIFDETPYLMVFLSKHCSSCQMTGPIYKTGGFAFAFRKNSSLVSNFSTAILNVTQNIGTFWDLKSSISLTTTVDRSEYESAVERRKLRIEDFGGLFPVVLCVLGLFLSLLVLDIICSKKVSFVTMLIAWLVPKIRHLIPRLPKKKLCASSA